MKRKYGLSNQNIYGLIKGTRRSVKGWFLTKDIPKIIKPNRRDARIFIFSHSEFGKFKGDKVDFCNETGVTHGNAWSLINGRQQTAKGWTVVKTIT